MESELKQVYIPSVNSGYFFTEEEQSIQDKISSLYQKKKENRKLIKQHSDKKDRERRKELRAENRKIDELIKLLRDMQLDLISKNQNVRSLSRPIQPKHYVGMFESILSRTLGLRTDEESNDLIIVEVYQSHDEILRQLLKNGFTYNGEEYVYFSSSSGQIKTRKAVFMKKSQWEKHQRTLMGGLSIEEINNKGGINPNKLLSYMMLANSATTKWEVNLREIIVIDDMETVVKGIVDFVDDETFEVSRGEKEITIKQTDGIGFCLPSVSDKAFMFRAPWMKGLIIPVPFDKYNGKTTKVTDCWNKTWDIVDDGIKIILHKSQFKLADYYESWEEYIDKFEKYHCEMAIGNVEDDHFKDATLTYQMLQTLTDVTDEELKEISQTTVNKINKVGRDKEVILDLLGVVEENKHKNYLQQAIELYPSIINDKYTRKVISETKKSYIKNARAGKIDLPNAKYTYVVPDVVAWMDWLFNKKDNPKGILGNEQVSCKLYEDGKRLDVLRSPHLYREHGLRNNVVNEETSKWFITNCIYISIDSLLSKLLQYDSDGDKLLITDDSTFVRIAERNMDGVVPLVYNMRSSDKKIINSEEIFTSLIAGFSANIGEISNSISRAWHSEEINQEVLEDIKILCAINNAEIDYSKTLWRPDVPKEIAARINKYQRGKLPHVFHYAKDKKVKNVMPLGNHTLDRLINLIPSTKIHFANLFGEFDWKMLMSNHNITLNSKKNKEIVEKYEQLNKQKKEIMKKETDENKGRRSAERYFFKYVKREMLKIHNNPKYIANVLVYYLYKVKNSESKDTLWNSFGKEIIENLKCNLEKTKICEDCQKRRIERKQGKKFCDVCAAKREKKRLRKINITRKKNVKKAL
jgi:hypothetical protein